MAEEKLCPIMSSAMNMVNCVGERCKLLITYTEKREDAGLPPMCAYAVVAQELVTLRHLYEARA